MSARISLFLPPLSRRPLMLAALLTSMLLAACGGSDDDPAPAAPAAPASAVAVGGAVLTPTSYTAAQLKALAATPAASMPAVTQTVTFDSGNPPKSETHTYNGVSLWSLFKKAVVQVDPDRKNDILRKYVVAKGSDGYRAVFSMGELSESFGNKGNLLVYDETKAGVTAPLSGEGDMRVTAPDDVKGGRYVSALAQLDVKAVAAAASAPVSKSTSFDVAGDGVLNPGSFDKARLQALPNVIDRTVVSGGVSRVYRGVDLWSFLNTTTGLKLDPGSNTKNQSLVYCVVATGTDGYQTVIALGELNPDFGNEPIMIAFQVGGLDIDDQGFARIVVPGDVNAGRWVSNLVKIEVLKAQF